MLNGEYLLVKKGFLVEYAMKRFNARKNPDSEEYRDFSANRFEQALAYARNIYSFDGVNATIRIEGPMSVDGPDICDLFCGLGGCSYIDIFDAAEKAAVDVNPDIGEVIIKMNTPGGTVNGCDTAFQALWKLSETHQIVVWNTGLIASAGQWLASAAHKIIAKTPVAFQGSIGVVLNFFDYSGMLEDFGIEEITITNFESPDKWPDLKTEKGKDVVIEELNAIYDVFRRRVIQGRDRALGSGKVTAETIDGLRGRVLIAEKAMEIGLTDIIEDSSTQGSGDGVSTLDADGPEVQANIDKYNSIIQREDEENENEGTERGNNMDLTKLLEDNPKAKAQYVDAIATAREEGAQSLRAVVDKAVPFLQSENYPVAIKNLAVDVVKGSVDPMALTSAVAAVDAVSENKASAAAEKETGSAPETPPASATGSVDKRGKIETPEDYPVSVAALRHAQGIPVEQTGGA